MHGCLHGLATLMGHSVATPPPPNALTNDRLLDAARVCVDVVSVLEGEPLLFAAQVSRCLRNVSCCDSQGRWLAMYRLGRVHW